MSVGATNGGSISADIDLDVESETANTNPWSNSDSIGVSVAFALNDVRSGAVAFIDHIDLQSGGNEGSRQPGDGLP